MHDEFKLSFHYFRSNSVKYKHEKLPDYVGPWASLVAQTIKNLPAMRETWVQSLGWKDPLEEGMEHTYSNILAWRSPWTEEPGGLCPWGHKESDTTE